MPGNFNPVVKINKVGRILPGAHPTGLAQGDRPQRLYVSVSQTGGFCVASILEPFEVEGWKLDPKKTDYFGDPFQPGPATGTGLMYVVMASGRNRTFVWSESITLAPEAEE